MDVRGPFLSISFFEVYLSSFFRHYSLPLDQNSQGEHQNPWATSPVSQLAFIEYTVLPLDGDEPGTRHLGFILVRLLTPYGQ
jgi:hypothetical protein